MADALEKARRIDITVYKRAIYALDFKGVYLTRVKSIRLPTVIRKHVLPTNQCPCGRLYQHYQALDGQL